MAGVSVKVLLNRNNTFTPYRDGDVLDDAASFTSGVPACGSVERLLEIVFYQLNMDYPTSKWAKKYRRQRHRSLSVGDVVMIADQAWAVEPLGWRRLKQA